MSLPAATAERAIKLNVCARYSEPRCAAIMATYGKRTVLPPLPDFPDLVDLDLAPESAEQAA